MTEEEYINLVNLERIRIIVQLMSELIPQSDVPKQEGIQEIRRRLIIWRDALNEKTQTEDN